MIIRHVQTFNWQAQKPTSDNQQTSSFKNRTSTVAWTRTEGEKGARPGACAGPAGPGAASQRLLRMTVPTQARTSRSTGIRSESPGA
jgi:hypothetical protein